MRSELHRCARFGDLERVKQLVAGGVDVEETERDDNNGMTALSLASLYHHYEIVVYLVEHGADVTHAGGVGKTALHWACGCNNLSSVIHLLEHGATITGTCMEGKTALLHAVYGGHLEVVQYLLSSKGGASISETDDAGNLLSCWQITTQR
jgi:ankyrin repeat protein